MASLNQLVSELAHTLSQPNNYALREQLRNSIIHTRNELIRHSMEQHGYVDSGLQQKFKVSTIALDDDGDFYAKDTPVQYKSVIRRTTQKVPKPTRFTNNLPFMRVSNESVLESREIPYIKETSARFRRWLPGMKGVNCYDYINGYIYIFPSYNKFFNFNKLIDLGDEVLPKKEHFENIIIESVFENPIEVNILNGEGAEFEYLNDDEWFLPEDMVGQIKDIILKREFANTNRENDETPNTIKMT